MSDSSDLFIDPSSDEELSGSESSTVESGSFYETPINFVDPSFEMSGFSSKTLYLTSLWIKRWRVSMQKLREGGLIPNQELKNDIITFSRATLFVKEDFKLLNKEGRLRFINHNTYRKNELSHMRRAYYMGFNEYEGQYKKLFRPVWTKALKTLAKKHFGSVEMMELLEESDIRELIAEGETPK